MGIKYALLTLKYPRVRNQKDTACHTQTSKANKSEKWGPRLLKISNDTASILVSLNHTMSILHESIVA